MTYTLQIDLAGAQGVENALQRIISLQNQLKSPGQSGSIQSGKTSSSGSIFDQFGRPIESTTRVLRSYTDAVKLARLETEKMEASFSRNLNKVLAYSSKVFPEQSGDFGTGRLPNIVTGENSNNWHDAHVKAWSETRTMHGDLDPSQVTITDYEKMDRDKQKASRIASTKRSDKYERRVESSREKEARDLVTFKKDMSFLIMPAFNPGSMWATLFSARQTYSAMNTMHGKEFRDKWMKGMSAEKATALLVGAATAAGTALIALRTIVGETVKAYAQGANLYKRSMTGGMGLQFESKRGILASILGVGENDVPRYGSQTSYLMPKISESAKILADTAPALTKVNWEFNVLKVDISALAAKLASNAGPAVMKFITHLDVLVKFLTKSSDVISRDFSMIKKTSPLYWFHRLTEAASNKLYGVTQSQVDKAYGGNASNFPTPNAWMKQLPASAWEKMGLVTFGGQVNYQKQIAQATRETVQELRKMGTQLMHAGGHVLFGMHPSVSNP
jgi:hypothetical protein